MAKKYSTVLSIAGSDSIGGAGIQADIKTCCAAGVYAMTVITAVTAQNTEGVALFEPVGATMLKAQLEVVLEDVKPDAVKIGMIPDIQSVMIIANMLRHYHVGNIVIDPVMVATSGHLLTASDTSKTLIDELFPIARIITPNLPEAEVLAPGDNKAERLLHKTNAVLLKGGHGDGDTLTDTLYRRDQPPLIFSHKRIQTRNTHGTGCSLSTMIACRLAIGLSLDLAVANAIHWLQGAIEGGKDFSLGHGHGPINHFYPDTGPLKT